MKKAHINLEDLEIYRLARELSQTAWRIYAPLDVNTKIIIGNQFIEATDSVGANIAEAYGRFHYLDRIKFLYNARGSLVEAAHWIELLKERDIVGVEDYEKYKKIMGQVSIKLQNFISSIYRSKDRPKQ